MAITTLAQIALSLIDSNLPLISGAVETISVEDDLLRLLPLIKTPNRYGEMPVEDTMGDSQALERGGIITANNPGTIRKIKYTVKSLYAQLDIAQMDDAFSSTSGGYARSGLSKEQQINGKAKSLANLMMTQLFIGDGLGANVTGLTALTPTSQFIGATSANGDSITAHILSNLLSQFQLSGGNAKLPDILVVNPQLGERLRSIKRNAPGNTGIDILTVGSNSPIVVNGIQLQANSARTLFIDGIPILESNYVPTNQVTGTSNNTTSVYAFKLDNGDADTGLGMVIPDLQDSMIQFEVLPTVSNQDVYGYRLKAYYENVLFNPKAMFIRRGITLT